jgi:hypothetical protein
MTLLIYLANPGFHLRAERKIPLSDGYERNRRSSLKEGSHEDEEDPRLLPPFCPNR